MQTYEAPDDVVDPILLAELEQQNANLSARIRQPNYRRCCGFTIGPKGHCGKFFVLTFLNILLLVGLFGLVLIDPDANDVWTYGFVLVGIVLAETICMCWVALRDPGYLNP